MSDIKNNSVKIENFVAGKNRINMSALLLLIAQIGLLTWIEIPAFAQNNVSTSQTFRDCADCPEMVVIPAGNLTIKCQAHELERFNEKGPEHRVIISQFAAGKFEITRGQWEAFVTATNRKTNKAACDGTVPSKKMNAKTSWRNPGFPQDNNHPVVCLSLEDVQDYLHWLSKKTGASYRLLTEAEWEYASASEIPTYSDDASDASKNDVSGKGSSRHVSFSPGNNKWSGTSPVDSLPPNAFGLYDMNSNVFQWVEDCYASSYSGVPINDPSLTAKAKSKRMNEFTDSNRIKASFRMIHGADGNLPAKMMRPGYHNWVATPGITSKDYRSSGLGFRVARS